jgi:hypothetical protein
VTTHPDFVEEDVTTNGNDIALVRLPRDAVTVLQDPEEFVLPVCLPKSAADVFENADEYLVLLQKKILEMFFNLRHHIKICNSLELVKPICLQKSIDNIFENSNAYLYVYLVFSIFNSSLDFNSL